MSITLEVAEKECGRYFKNYAKCVEKYPETWHFDCSIHKQKLAKCAETDPVVMEIKDKCAQEYKWYESCSSKNPLHLENCTQQFNAFDSCAVKISASFKHQQSESKASKGS